MPMNMVENETWRIKTDIFDVRTDLSEIVYKGDAHHKYRNFTIPDLQEFSPESFI